MGLWVFAYILLLNSFGLLILLFLYTIKPFKYVKICLLRYERIGHLAVNTDLFLRRLQLKEDGEKRIFYLGLSGKPANRQLLKMLRRRISIIENRFLYDIFNASLLRKSSFCLALPYIKKNEHYIYADTKPVLTFNNAEEIIGVKLLKKMGINGDAWFVCFHSRDSIYLSNQWSKQFSTSKDWSYHDYRDCDIENCVEAMRYISSCGGFAIRMGYGVARKLPESGDARIIDYASLYRNDFGDIYLSAKCKFFLGNTAGLILIPPVFEVPVACANWIPMDQISPVLIKNVLLIPKKIWSIENKRLLTFREVLEGEIGHWSESKKYAEAGLEVVQNTAQEILDLAREMNERLDGCFKSTDEDEELQNRFRSLFRPHYNAYECPPHIAATFLRQNRELLE